MVPKVYKYANGGKVARKGPKRPRPTAGSTADTMLNTRARQMKSMGLADGGRPKLPDKGTRVVKPIPLPPPQSGAKPKKIGKR